MKEIRLLVKLLVLQVMTQLAMLLEPNHGTAAEEASVKSISEGISNI
ncbi:hypothetical protein BHO_0900069 (plasmid) [Borrelia hermsii YBT]|uniref:Uncharacterized protein n=1 Tax=Borrelia hermsii YBT TaxID=1313295 RepID=W5T264_BORHE|nr:hypothetical protein [Borrelia hermsii]AHH13332.1 hypothetical protein BHO_0900069 [Borrelia hermsii YBT]